MDKWKRWGAGGLAALAVAAYHGVGLTSLAGQNGDDSVYLMLGQAIAEGLGYRSLSTPGTPPHVMYPPGYPLLLASVWAFWPAWPANVIAFKALNVAAIGLAAAGLYRLATQVYGMKPALAALAAAITAFSGAVTLMVDLTMSELVYMAAVVGALGVFEPRFAASAGARCGLLAGLLVGAVMAVKTLGFTLGAACAAWLGLARRWAALAGLAVGGALALGPWVWWVATSRAAGATADADYVSWGRDNLGGDLVARIAANAGTMVQVGAPLTYAPIVSSAWFPPAAATVLIALVLAIAALGFWVSARRRLRVWHLYLLGFTAFVMSFPWDPTRYMTTATPWLALAFATGCERLLGVAGRARVGARVVCALAIATTLAGPLVRVASLVRHGVAGDGLLPPHEIRMLADRRAFSAWAHENLPPDALLVHERQTLAWLDTGLQGVAYFEGDHPSAATLRSFAARPTWVVIVPGSDEYKTTHQALAKLQGPGALAFRGPSGTLEAYRIGGARELKSAIP